MEVMVLLWSSKGMEWVLRRKHTKLPHSLEGNPARFNQSNRVVRKQKTNL
ncbi:hypothetical protein V6Z11_D07G080900 [Gossypium hirsutum]